MTDIEQIEKLIELLTKIVMYIAPGYISIVLFKVSQDSIVKDNKMTLIKSIFISYIYVSIVHSIPVHNIPIFSREFADALEIILIAILAFSVGIFATPIINSKLLSNITVKLHHTTITSNLIGDIKGLAKDNKGIYLMVYLENEGIAYDGYLVVDRMNEEMERFIILDCYRKYIILKQEPGYKLKVKYDHSKSNNDFTVIHYSRITQIEFSVDELKNKDNQVNE